MPGLLLYLDELANFENKLTVNKNTLNTLLWWANVSV